LPEAHDFRAANAKGAMFMGISHKNDAFVQVEKPHAFVRSFIPTYGQRYFLAVLTDHVKTFLRENWR